MEFRLFDKRAWRRGLDQGKTDLCTRGTGIGFWERLSLLESLQKTTYIILGSGGVTYMYSSRRVRSPRGPPESETKIAVPKWTRLKKIFFQALMLGTRFIPNFCPAPRLTDDCFEEVQKARRASENFFQRNIRKRCNSLRIALAALEREISSNLRKQACFQKKMRN